MIDIIADLKNYNFSAFLRKRDFIFYHTYGVVFIIRTPNIEIVANTSCTKTNKFSLDYFMFQCYSLKIKLALRLRR